MAELGVVKLKKMNPALSKMTITVKVTKEFKLRYWIALKLITVAAKILGF